MSGLAGVRPREALRMRDATAVSFTPGNTYGLLVVLIAIASMAGAKVMGTETREMYEDVYIKIDGAGGIPGGGLGG